LNKKELIEEVNYFKHQTTKKKSSKKFLEDEKTVLEKKSYSKEHETFTKKENSNSAFDKFDLYFKNEEEDIEAMSLNVGRKSIKKKTNITQGFTQIQETIPSNDDEYKLLKAMSINYSESLSKKTRANSILRMLEINVDEKRKLTSCDA
jgi:uncharacterized protein YkuJ